MVKTWSETVVTPAPVSVNFILKIRALLPALKGQQAQEALAYRYPLDARVAQMGLIDALYACMALKRCAEVEQNHPRIAAALHVRQG